MFPSTWFFILAAFVPSLFEYLKRWVLENLISFTKFLVSSWFFSLSFGKPTIISVVSPAFGKYSLIKSTFSLKTFVVYFLFINFKTSSEPDWRDKWKWSQAFFVSFILCKNPLSICLGSIDDNLILSIPSIFAMCSITSINEISKSKSFP